MPGRTDAVTLWFRLAAWAGRWHLPAPALSAGWDDLPPSFAPLAVDGWVTRPVFEPAAGDDAAGALEALTGLTLPADLRALHAVHDGSYAPLLPYGMSILGYEAVGTTWRTYAGLADEFAFDREWSADGTHLTVPYHRGWLPVASADDVCLVLDFDPGPQGTPGQVLLPLNEVDHAVVGHSFTDFLRRWLTLLDQGRVVFDPDHGHAVPTPDAEYADLLREVGG